MSVLSDLEKSVLSDLERPLHAARDGTWGAQVSVNRLSIRSNDLTGYDDSQNLRYIGLTVTPCLFMPEVVPSRVDTIVALLHHRAVHQSQQTAYTFLRDGETDAISLTYQELARRVQVIAAHLQSHCAPGDRAVLLYPPGLDYLTAFFGCLAAGVIAVPAYPPRPNRPLDRLQVILANCDARAILTTQPLGTKLPAQLASWSGANQLQWLVTDHLQDPSQPWSAPTLTGDSIAFLQYTSGSTAAPKGVIISHRNLLHNLSLIHQCFEHEPHSRGVIWLPPYHDMGLIGGILQPLYGGFPVTLMSPLMFLQSPLRWLQAITRYGATTSGGPSFAYDLCVRKIKPAQRQTLDLSSWQVAFNGAEPIRPDVMARFADTFEPYGFRPEVFYPCYGLAEATLIVSGGLNSAPPVMTTVAAAALAQDPVIVPRAHQTAPRTLVGCGHTLPSQQIWIVNPHTLTACRPQEVGEIWVAGPSVAQGYWRQPEATAQTFEAEFDDRHPGPYLRTGDLGFLDGGELFVTGRLKDLIIINGRNHYPQDIEWTVEQSHPSVQPSGAAAFALDIEAQEHLIVLAEIDRRYFRAYRPGLHPPATSPAAPDLTSVPSWDPNQVRQQIQRAVVKQHDLQVHDLLLLKPGSLPKTSSGKIQRYTCRAKFVAGTLALQSIFV